MAVQPGLVVLAIVFYIAPLVLAILNDRQVRAFQKYAFGHFEKAARNLRIMIWFVFVYYVGVLIGSLVIGDLPAMWEFPMPAEGVQIYVRIGAAAAAYVFALFVSKELYLVTKPSER